MWLCAIWNTGCVHRDNDIRTAYTNARPIQCPYRTAETNTTQAHGNAELHETWFSTNNVPRSETQTLGQNQRSQLRVRIYSECVHVLFRYISVSKCPCSFIRAPIINQQLIDASTFYDARSRNMWDQSKSCIYADTIQMHETNAYSAVGWTEQLTRPKSDGLNSSYRLITLIQSFVRTTC